MTQSMSETSLNAFERNDMQPARVRVNLASQQETVARLVEAVSNGFGFNLFTINLDHLVKLRKDKAFRDAYLRARYVTADGWPIALMMRQKGAKVERTTGADLVKPLCQQAAEKKIPVAFFGSSEDSLKKAADELHALYPDLEVVLMESPPYGFDPTSEAASEAAERIAASGAKLCFVALGAPKQELFSDMAHAQHKDMGFLCIGAALDFISGEQSRAPEIMQKTGLEWFYRLVTNPRRMFARYAQSAISFATVYVQEMLGRENDLIDFQLEQSK